ncbi:type 4a pilus biogenesis protein PilO [Sulfurimonas sp.]
MRINIEDYLHKIDFALKGKKQNELYMTYAMIVVIVFAFAYLLFWDSSFEGFEKTQARVEQLKTKITKDKRYLQLNPESKIVRLEQEIKKINGEIIQYKDYNAYIKSKIEEISSLIYNERTWGEYIDSITTNAQKYNVKILDLTNKYAKTDGFGHVLDITVNFTGRFKNTIKFINSLEKSELVVDLHTFDIVRDKKLTTDLKISVWGITY